MFARRLLLSLTGLALSVAAVALPGGAQELPGATDFTVAGTVLNSATGQPVARAEVFLGSDRAQLTGGDGGFSFEHVPAGGVEISIRKPGYEGMGAPGMRGGGFHRFSHASSIPSARIVVGPEMPPLTIRLTPLASISGRLTLSTADAADQIRVMLFHQQFENGRSRWAVVDMEKTRNDGSWRAADLPAGRYLVQATASIDGPNDPGNSQVPVWGFPALYYPGVTDPASAGVLILKAGQQVQADMTLARQRFFPVTVAVHGMPDNPTSFQIVDSGGRPTGLPVRFDLQSRTAHANVPNGSWTLLGRAFGTEMSFGRADFQVAGAPVSMAISIAAMPPIPAAIHRDFVPSADGSQPPAEGPGVNLFLISADEFSMSPFGGNLRSDTNRAWEINVTASGRYWVQADAFPPAYIVSITSGGTDLATTPLTVVPGTPPAPIEITLRNDAGTIAGKVDRSAASGNASDGELSQVWIYAIPLFATTGHLPEASPQGNGQFQFANLAPGSYRVVACDAPQEIDFHSQDGLAAWSGKGKVVTVDPNGTANVELSVIHGEPRE